jgi:NAD(P)-dependent dehydrogenase (short-subunit alcohol dehydrogenase family)
MPADVLKRTECERIAIRILVNHAAILRPVAPAEATSPEQWDEVLAINLTSAFRM